mmetsp:Transcript_22709/g.40463  ORF Transcript_22709/g.40463 Transcript_22709/m.40463 type:complete len:1094 (+) Transcript_22709:257-3538(+)|eukprot:CAMPEP_0201636438 /NCGR_PEP_ID=MMETSP0493-20130528/8595_1 /ASSEMBLY_ACC=CAM_ASM_000838 /TAXON_ID=420259 /ORGANISM="Thalassiosira gravida, Strain GMp14c1" /LENGTH=1093 /DNA_ID=CAMNT_0048108537 /DNA_START=108 /DNA_END=3389 /DNA_ORIENTATION=-
MGACNSAPTAAVADTTAAAPHPSPSSNRVNNSACKSGGKCSSNGIRESVMGGTLSSEAGGAPNSTEAKQNIKLDARTAALSPTSPVSTATTISTASPPANIIAVVPPKDDYGPPIQDVSISSNLSTDSSHSSNSSSNNRTKTNMAKHEHLRDLGTSSHRDRSRNRRKSRLLSHTDSRVGLEEIICGDLPNPNLVRIEVPLGKPIEEVYDGVHDGPVLGSGISGIVRLVTHRATQVAYAVKCLDLALIDSEEGLKQLKEEIYIMCQLDHPNIVRLEEVYESHSEIYLVQEVCKGGELFDRLDEQPDYHYTEAQCARLVKQMLRSVRYIHNKGIIHRDLKLENFLFSEGEAESELKMIDFGLSKHFTFGEVHHEAVGTPYTVAPEVIKGSYDERCDVWAIGVITYLLLSGEPPFGGCGGPETLMQVRDNILRGAYDLEPHEVWQTVSQEAKDFIRSLLVVDPMARPTALQAKESKWLRMWSSRENGGKEADSMINPNVVKALVGFKEYSDMKKLLCEVLSFTLLPDQIQGLQKEFEKYDQEGTGEITLSTLKKVLIGNASTGSLGGLTEEEVVDIFNAMRVRKGETSIHWHDFIAAGLSQCQVDDRNLRLAFERLDQDHKGYITFENVMDLMGDGSFENEDQMLKMWGESMKDVNLRFINYDDFVLLMKGQKRDPSSRFMRASLEGLAAVPEITFEEEDDPDINAAHSPPMFREQGFPMHPLDATTTDETTAALGKPNLEVLTSGLLASPGCIKTFVRMGSNSAPATPDHFGKRFDEIDQVDSRLSINEVDGGDSSVSFNDQVAFEMPDIGNLTPPQTPVRGPADYVTPISAARATAMVDSQLMSRLTPPDLSMSLGVSPLSSLTRGRSVSLDENESDASFESRRSMMFKRDSRRAMAIPEHTHDVSGIDRVIEDMTKTPLVVNRALYRAHREFRHAVTEACKRFEDEQLRRAKETLSRTDLNYSAGLVMRHGQALSERSIKSFLKKTMEEQQKKVDQANRRGGRGGRSRKKTISDMSGMMGPSPPEAPTPTVRQTVDLPKEEALAPVKENENLLRNPTKPGEFRKTNYDPFQRKSMFEIKGGAGRVTPPPPPLL